jgi:4'-phosphopantetheinyl transferase
LRRRAGKLHFPEDRGRFVQAHAALRQILHHYTGVEPSALHFSLGPHGKPHLDPAGLNFSLSHSGDLAAVAVGEIAEIGIDLEKTRPIADWEEVARLWFHPAEIEWVRSAADARRRDAFFEVWTAKEAYIKANGRGLSQALDAFSVVGAAPQQEYIVTRLELPEGYAGALAHPPPRRTITQAWWQPR